MLRFKRRGLLAMGLSSLFSALLGPAKAKIRDFADVAEFREYVMAAFKREPGVDSIVADPADPARFKVVAGEQSWTADVTNIFGHIRAYPDEDPETAVARFIRSLTEPPGVAIDDGDIVAVIRGREYVDDTLSVGMDPVHEPLTADLVIMYMADRPDSISSIKTTELPGKDLADIRRIALDNVRRWLPKVVSDPLGGSVLYYVEGNTLLSPSLILLDEFWKSIAALFPGDVLFAIPRRDQLFIFDDGNPEVRALARRLIRATIEEDFNLLSPTLYARRAGKIVAVSD